MDTGPPKAHGFLLFRLSLLVEPFSTPHATRSVSITDSHTALADTAPRRAAESSGAACRTVPLLTWILEFNYLVPVFILVL